jgi:phosphohistidine phosphatase
MPRLLLVRHAEAVSQVLEGDSGRPLTAQGQADARRVGVYLRASGLIPDRAISSPVLRARATLDLILRELPPEPPASELYGALYHADAEAFIEIAAQTSSAVKTLLVIGHHPGVGEFARRLVEPANALPQHFSAPSLAVIDINSCEWSETSPGCGSLRQFMDFAST